MQTPNSSNAAASSNNIMAQQYTFSSHEGKHPSYYNRPVSTFQLQAQATPFNNGVSVKNANIPFLATQYPLEDPRYAYDGADATYTNDSNPQSRPRHINSKARESQLAEVITHSSFPEYGNNDSKQLMIDQAALDRAQKAQSLIGGQNAGNDAYKTTAQIQLNGDFNQKTRVGSKRIDAQNPDQLISPITGKLVANYGDWRDNAAQKQAYETAAANRPASTSDDNSSSHPLIEKVRAALASRGANGVLGMARLFRIMDDDDSKSLSMPEFKKAMRESSLMLQDSELTTLFKLFDTDNSGSISYEEYIHVMRVSIYHKSSVLHRLLLSA